MTRKLWISLALAGLLSGCWHSSADTRDRYQAAYEDAMQSDAKADAAADSKK